MTLTTKTSNTAFVIEYTNPICLAASLLYSEITTSGGLPLSDPRIQTIQPLGLVTFGVQLTRAHSYDPSVSLQCSVADPTGYVYQSFPGTLSKLRTGFSSSPQLLTFTWTAPSFNTVLLFGCHWTGVPMIKPPARQLLQILSRPKIPVRLIIDHYDPVSESSIIIAPDQYLTGSVSIDSYLSDPGIIVFGNTWGIFAPTFSAGSLVSLQSFGPFDTIGSITTISNSLMMTTEYVQVGVPAYTVVVGSCTQTEDGHLMFSAPPGTPRTCDVPRFPEGHHSRSAMCSARLQTGR